MGAEDFMLKTPLRGVLDTNCVVSALMFPRGRTGRLCCLWMQEAVKPVVCRETALELFRVLSYPKFKLDADEIEWLLSEYLPYYRDVLRQPTGRLCRAGTAGQRRRRVRLACVGIGRVPACFRRPAPPGASRAVFRIPHSFAGRTRQPHGAAAVFRYEEGRRICGTFQGTAETLQNEDNRSGSGGCRK